MCVFPVASFSQFFPRLNPGPYRTGHRAPDYVLVVLIQHHSISADTKGVTALFSHGAKGNVRQVAQQNPSSEISSSLKVSNIVGGWLVCRSFLWDLVIEAKAQAFLKENGVSLWKVRIY